MKITLNLEELAMFAISLYYFAQLPYVWWWCAVLFLTPDLSMLGYLVNAKVGAISYNLFHRPIREGFSYDAIENAYVCGNKKLLYYHGIKMDKGFANHYYHAKVNRIDDA